MDLAAQASLATSHLWFLDDRPTSFDLGRELLARASENESFSVPDPEFVPTDEIRYYRDPWQRLTALHTDTIEMLTGFVYKPPW